MKEIPQHLLDIILSDSEELENACREVFELLP